MILWALALLFATTAAADSRPGVAPDTPWSCPATHPVKGYVTDAGHRVYYAPDAAWYEEASPERCYANEADAMRDGGRPSRRLLPPGRTDALVRLIRETPRSSGR